VTRSVRDRARKGCSGRNHRTVQRNWADSPVGSDLPFSVGPIGVTSADRLGRHGSL